MSLHGTALLLLAFGPLICADSPHTGCIGLTLRHGSSSRHADLRFLPRTHRVGIDTPERILLVMRLQIISAGALCPVADSAALVRRICERRNVRHGTCILAGPADMLIAYGLGRADR